MRLSSVLRKQHIDRMFKRHWLVQGKRNIIETGAQEALQDRGIPVIDAQEVGFEKREKIHLNIVGFAPKPIKFDHTHPNYHERPCHLFKDHNVLLEGVKQSMVLTKTVQLRENCLPDHIQEEVQQVEVTDKVHEIVKRAIFSANVFDAYQDLLPKVKDPLRPAFNFPRRLGITDQRKNFILSTKLLQLCEVNSSQFSKRNIVQNVFFSIPLEKDNDLVQFQLHVENFIVSQHQLKPIIEEVSQTESLKLHDMFPVKSTVTLLQENIYELKDVYPIKFTSSLKAPHTILINFMPTYVHNIYETPVTADQTLGRSLIKSFTVAASYAKKKYGDDVKVLPKPVTIQCVQTDGRLFDFSVFQLNTLDLNGSNGVKNIFYQTEQVPLYTNCSYERGIPILEGYNPEVVKYLFTFYKNQ